LSASALNDLRSAKIGATPEHRTEPLPCSLSRNR
jgi:hypothetical protein